MPTLKEHQQAMVNLLANGSAIPASAARLAHAMHDLLAAINAQEAMSVAHTERRSAATTSGLNDAMLAMDVKACAPQKTSQSGRIKELENTIKQLRDTSKILRQEKRALEDEVAAYKRELSALPEQAGCRKHDTQISPCEHEWTDTGRELYCKKCKVHPSDSPQTANNGWINWAGGECPTTGDTDVVVMFRDCLESEVRSADFWSWKHEGKIGDIIAYRVIG